MEYQKLFRETVDELSKKYKDIIVCGGTGLYIRASIYDYVFKEEQEVDTSDLEEMDNDELYELLMKLDPESTKTIHKNNRKRVIRAIAFKRSEGISKSENISSQEHKLIYDEIKILRNNKEETISLNIGDEVCLEYPYYEIYNDSIKVYPSSNEGPSAGFMQSLKLYDDLIDDDLCPNLKIAGTGTIDELGNVGAIGCIDLKIYTAIYNKCDIFFIPNDNKEEASKALDKINTKMKIVYVDTLSDAINYLRSLN